MSRVSARERAAVEALADERAGVAGLVQCEGCPHVALVPAGGEFDGLCSRHWHQTQFRYGIQGGVSHA
jgi:hypothetical protein